MCKFARNANGIPVGCYTWCPDASTNAFSREPHVLRKLPTTKSASERLENDVEMHLRVTAGRKAVVDVKSLAGNMSMVTGRLKNERLYNALTTG